MVLLDHDPVPDMEPSRQLTRTLLTVMAAGGVGATLCNFRGLFRHMQHKCGFFPRRLQTPFYLRPAMGMLSGITVFFLAHLLAASVGADAAAGGWETVKRRFSFIALALLGGFASQELMQRMKESRRQPLRSRAPRRARTRRSVRRQGASRLQRQDHFHLECKLNH